MASIAKISLILAGVAAAAAGLYKLRDAANKHVMDNKMNSIIKTIDKDTEDWMTALVREVDIHILLATDKTHTEIKGIGKFREISIKAVDVIDAGGSAVFDTQVYTIFDKSRTERRVLCLLDKDGCEVDVAVISYKVK